ncbi:MAG: hypothetical protein OXC66_02100 [Roseovarius sp.]|nr:hypothetical protein [Roseovarius sp.]
MARNARVPRIAAVRKTRVIALMASPLPSWSRRRVAHRVQRVHRDDPAANVAVRQKIPRGSHLAAALHLAPQNLSGSWNVSATGIPGP